MAELCPECQGTRPIGLLRQGTHLVWRIHDRLTVGGARIPCRASGVAVCETGLRGLTRADMEEPLCRHS